MKSSNVIWIIIVILVLLSIPIIIFLTAPDEEEVAMSKEVSIPPIDATRPTETETATFAMG